MSIFSRFFGRKNSENEISDSTDLVANPESDNKLSLIVLFPTSVQLNANILVKHLQQFDRSLSGAKVELDDELCQKGTPFGLVGWSNHVIQMVGFDVAMPVTTLDNCVQGAHYSQELKQQAYQHQANILLYYAGYETNPLKQYQALACVAGVLAELGANIVINENAHTSLPAAIFCDKSDGNIIELIESIPLLMLFCGFVKYQIENVDGLWIRTYGAHLLGMPDLAVLAHGHEDADYYFQMFSNLFSYLQDSGAQFNSGDTMQIGDDQFMKLRTSESDEYFLDNEGALFVIEIINASDANQ